MKEKKHCNVCNIPSVLLLSAYDAQSHRQWWKGLVRALDHWNWCVKTLPARYFSWRFRGNALSWL
ncbi:MAG: DUF3524 domain-containing protein, partial [Myxococcota bacterium]